MVMQRAETEALDKLREAIVALVAEDLGMVDELNEWTEDVLNAWNDFANAGVHGKPIIDANIEAEFDDHE